MLPPTSWFLSFQSLSFGVYSWQRSGRCRSLVFFCWEHCKLERPFKPPSSGTRVDLASPHPLSSLCESYIGSLLTFCSVCIGSIYRFTIVHRLGEKDITCTQSRLALSPLQLIIAPGGLVDPAIWAFVENAIGIVSACLPVLRPIYSIIVNRHYCRLGDPCRRCQSQSDSKTRRAVSVEAKRHGRRYKEISGFADCPPGFMEATLKEPDVALTELKDANDFPTSFTAPTSSGESPSKAPKVFVRDLESGRRK